MQAPHAAAVTARGACYQTDTKNERGGFDGMSRMPDAAAR